jgi:hypothetical protein
MSQLLDHQDRSILHLRRRNQSHVSGRGKGIRKRTGFLEAITILTEENLPLEGVRSVE